MFRSGISRVLVSARFVAGGFAGVGGLLITGATPALASGPNDCPPSTMCVTPTADRHQVVTVIVRGAPANDTIAVTECNENLAGAATRTCATITQPTLASRGVSPATTNARGRAEVQYKVLVSSTKPVGDGNCLAGGAAQECRASSSRQTSRRRRLSPWRVIRLRLRPNSASSSTFSAPRYRPVEKARGPAGWSPPGRSA